MRGLPPQLPPATVANSLLAAEALAWFARAEFGSVQVASGFGDASLAETRPCVIALGRLEAACQQAAAMSPDNSRDAVPRQEHARTAAEMLARIRPRLPDPQYTISRLVNEATRTILAAAHRGIESEPGGREVLGALADVLAACEAWLPHRSMPVLAADDSDRLERAAPPRPLSQPRAFNGSARPRQRPDGRSTILNVRIPRPLRARAAAACAARGETLTAALSALLAERFPHPEAAYAARGI